MQSASKRRSTEAPGFRHTRFAAMLAQSRPESALMQSPCLIGCATTLAELTGWPRQQIEYRMRETGEPVRGGR